MDSRNQKRIILHLIETGGPGGAEKVLIDLASGFNDGRFESIVCLRKEGWLSGELIKRGIETHVFSENEVNDIVFLVKLLEIVQKRRVSIIHAHEFLMNAYSTFIGILSRKPVLTTVHGKSYYCEAWRRMLMMRFASRFSRMITVSNDLLHFLVEMTGIKPHRLKTIYNGIDLAAFKPASSVKPTRLSIGINENDFVIGTVGNLYLIKGHTYLINAIPIIVREVQNVVFLFAGRGDQEEHLRTETVNLGIQSKVKFLGFRSNVPELLSLMDVFVLPSLGECLPLSILEAMAMCVPPVVTDVGGNKEIIENGKTGYLVPPGDTEALAEKILFLLRDKGAAEAIGRDARKKVEEKFSLELMLANYDSMYRSLLSKEHDYSSR